MNAEAPTTTPDPTAPDRLGRVRELQSFALERLPSLQLGDGAFCHEVSAESGWRPTGRSLRYTLIVLVGLLRAEDNDIDHPFHTGGLRSRLLSELASEELTAGDIGLFLWAESRGDGRAMGELLAALARRLPAEDPFCKLETFEVAWILTGLAEAATRGESATGEELLGAARRELLEVRQVASGLMIHLRTGPRKRLPHFADQIHSALALSQLARDRDDADAREGARRVADRIVATQLDDGGWPWICDPVRGRVVEPYELYSVHQDALAMIGLHGVSQATGDDSYRAAAARGLDWLYGENQLGIAMFDREAGAIYRSIRRRQSGRRFRQAGSAARALTNSAPRSPKPAELEVNRSMRPFHLGWLLEAWAGREELALSS